MVRHALVFLVLITYSSTPLAQPSITGASGQIDQGETITITGTGFGVKSPAAPILWDDFEGREVGSALDDDPNWTRSDGPGSTTGGTFSDVSPYSGSLSAYNRTTASGAEDPVSANFNTSNHWFETDYDTIYYSYMSRRTRSGDTYGIYKNGKINAGSNFYDGDGTVMFSNGMTSFRVGSNYNLVYWTSGCQYPPCPPLNPEGTWNRHELYGAAGTPGVANGEVWFAARNHIGRHEQDVVVRPSGSTVRYSNIMLGLMTANPQNDGDHRMWIDDVYVDNTLARVEIGNNVNFAFSTKRDIQIPITWTSPNDEITATVNVPGFDEDEVAYLFVVDADGNASHGYEITIGSTGTSPGFAAPTPGGVSGGVITGLTLTAYENASHYTCWVTEAGSSVPRTAGVFSSTYIADIPTSTLTGTVYVTAHAANDSLLATSQAAAYGGN